MMSDSNQCVVIRENEGEAGSLEPTLRKRRQGRASSDLWKLFSEATNPQLQVSSLCRHCNAKVTYYKKSERVKSHLLKCKPFFKSMISIDEKDRPAWLISEMPNKKLKSDSSASMSQLSMRAFALPCLKPSEHKKIAYRMAMHYYITGSSFQRIDQHHLAEAFKIARPDIKLPTRAQLAGPLLEQCYLQCSSTLDNTISASDGMACLVTDGSSNINNESIVNYMLVLEGRQFFLESVATEEQGHTADYIAEDLSRVIDKLIEKGVKIAGAVTDNTAANRRAWRILKEKNPALYFHGCSSHSLHLMVKDIFAATKAMRGRPVADYPEGYPFEYLLHFTQDCKDVVSFFSYHAQDKAKLVKLQSEYKKRHLEQPAATRWGSLINCLRRLKESELILHRLVSARDFITGTEKQKASRRNVMNIICNEHFLTNLNKSIRILEPIDVGIKAFQSDSAPLSKVYHHLALSMKESFANMSCLSSEERCYISNLIDERLEFMYGDAIGIAYLLDPVMLGDGMMEHHKTAAENALFCSGEVDSNDEGSEQQKKEQLFSEYTDWIIKADQHRSKNDFRFQMLKKGTKSTMQYWQVDGKAYPNIRKVAIQVFSMATSSAASERGFSAMSFVHSKLRNRLSAEKVKKLIFIKNNAPQLMCADQAVEDWGDSDTDGGDSDEYQDNEVEVMEYVE